MEAVVPASGEDCWVCADRRGADGEVSRDEDRGAVVQPLCEVEQGGGPRAGDAGGVFRVETSFVFRVLLVGDWHAVGAGEPGGASRVLCRAVGVLLAADRIRGEAPGGVLWREICCLQGCDAGVHSVHQLIKHSSI